MALDNGPARNKADHMINEEPRDPSPKYAPKRRVSLCPQKGLPRNIYCNIMDRSQKMETTHVPFSREMHALE